MADILYKEENNKIIINHKFRHNYNIFVNAKVIFELT